MKFHGNEIDGVLVGGLNSAERFNFREMDLARRKTAAWTGRAWDRGKLVREQEKARIVEWGRREVGKRRQDLNGGAVNGIRRAEARE